MKHPIISSLLLTMIPLSLLSQLTIDDALLNSSENMKLNGGFSLSSGNLHKTSFGSFKTIDIHKGKAQLVGKHKEAYLEIKNKKSSIKNAVSTVNSQPFSLTIVQEGGDTIISNIDLTTVKGGGHALIEMKSGNAQDDENNKTNYCEDIQVQVKTDSLIWHMPPNDDQHADYDDFPLSFDRTLTNGLDKIIVTGAEGFPTKRKLFKNATRGVVFLYNKKQVAALETYPDTSIWFSNDINEVHKEVIAAVIISLLSPSDSKW